MSIPDAAVEAAAEALARRNWGDTLNAADYIREARAAIEAAMPAIREALAQEIEAAGRADVEWLARVANKDKTDMGRLIGSEDAWKDALRIVRGGAV